MSRPSANYPSYLALARTGELRQRAEQARAALAACRVCPRLCGANRLQDERGQCGIGRLAVVSSAFPHHGEEPCLRGWRGSGTLFFCGCNLHCVFCQNYDISHQPRSGTVVTAQELAELMLELQAAGCHNINWVTPSHVAPQLLEALVLAAERGLSLPVVYNSSGYDSVETLRWFDGVVDIYLPDFKFWDSAVAERLAGAPDYPAVARAALKEMYRQVGDFILDEKGLARRGLLVRHLIMPRHLAGTEALTAWLAREISPRTSINLMAQYHPAGRAAAPQGAQLYPELTRPITATEYRQACAAARAAGLPAFRDRY